MKVDDTFFALAKPFLEHGVLDHADVYSVALVGERFGERQPERLLGLAFAARAPRVGHPGVDLRRIASQVDDERQLQGAVAGDAVERDEDTTPLSTLPWPTPEAWATTTLASPMVGPPEESKLPFVRQDVGDRELLLTQRMFHEQQLVASALCARAAEPVMESDRVRDLERTLETLFPGEAEGESAMAVRIAVEHRLALVVGGPGTGKTFSVSRLLAALLAGEDPSRPLSIALAAPTGKAAARMREALREAVAPEAKISLTIPSKTRERLQTLPSQTIHRLIGLRSDGTARHGRDNPVAARVVIVDEVSMVDLALMRRLLDAVHPEARLVLLGDRDQLASVEAGCVLADLVSARTAPLTSSSALTARTQTFTVSRRFASSPDIGLVAACLQSYATSHPEVPGGDDDDARLTLAVKVLAGNVSSRDERFPGRRVAHLGPPDRVARGGASEPPAQGEQLESPTRGAARPSSEQLTVLAAPYVDGFDLLTDSGTERVLGYVPLLRALRSNDGGWLPEAYDPVTQRALIAAFDSYRVLAVHRRGPLGVEGLERALAARVRDAIVSGSRPGARANVGRHWIGRPILITRNAYDLGLMNGDVGLVLPTREGPAGVFPDEEPGRVQVVALSRLPPHEGALAMTVHKSQGSQFNRVALVLSGRASPIQTRELVYTGVTRAKNQLAWLGDLDELRMALSRRIERASGLGALLA